MSRRLCLFPKCHADTALTRFLIQDEELYRHSRGSEVAGDMRAASQNFDLVIGIMDGDKASKPRYFDPFDLIGQENNIQVRQKPDSGEYLIVILGRAGRPWAVGIETFILQNAEQAGIDLTEYGFEKVAKKLSNRFKKPGIETDPDYLRLLTDLLARDAPGLLTLRRMLTEFMAA